MVRIMISYHIKQGRLISHSTLDLNHVINNFFIGRRFTSAIIVLQTILDFVEVNRKIQKIVYY